MLAGIEVVAALAVLLAASDVMVHQLRTLGERLGLTTGVIGLLVAVGADSPEISTAVAALAAGSQEIGLGVVEGSNIYNLAGLLGLGALAAGSLALKRRETVEHAGPNLVITAAAVGLVLLSTLRPVLAIVTLLSFGLYLWRMSREERRDASPGSRLTPLALASLAVVAVVLMAIALVRASIALVGDLGIPQSVIGIFVLPVATSLPNTWAAIRLARAGMANAVISTTFASNSINLVFGVAVPSFFITFHPTGVERFFDGPYLLGMTVLAFVLLLSANRLSRREGALIALLYVAFAVVRMNLMGR